MKASMNGLPPTNPPLSCSEQMPSTITIPKLDTSYQILSGMRSECGDTDGEYLSTSTTPLNYMRHVSPTNKEESIILGKNNSNVACEPTYDINLNLNNLKLSYSADEFLSSQSTLNMQSNCLYDKSGGDDLLLDHNLSCRSIDTEFGINSINGDMSSIDFNNTFQKPPHPMGALFISKNNNGNGNNQRAEERRNSLYTTSPSTTASWEPDCSSSSLALPPTAQHWSQYQGAGAASIHRYEVHESVPCAARNPAAAPMFSPPQQHAPQQTQSPLYCAHSGVIGCISTSSPPSSTLHCALPRVLRSYATATQTPPPIVSYQSHQQPMPRSPPQLPMQPHQQQYQQTVVAEAYYANMDGVAPTRTVQQLPGYATATQNGGVVAPPSRSNVPAGYKPSAMPMQQQYQYQGMPASSALGAPMLQNLIYQVHFKRGSRSFTLNPLANFHVNVHDFVVVEGDRGEDIGIVVEILGMHAFMERRMSMPRRAAQQDQDDQNVGCILRLATLHERQMLSDKFHTEKDIVQSCNELACYGFGLPIVVVDAELQFDRRKLTLYYECSVRIDFRDFVRQLYATYKARIWMKKLDQLDQPDVQPFAAMALATGVQFSQSNSISSSSSSGMHGY